MSSDASNKLTRYVSATTIVTSDTANMWYGGLYGTSDGSYYDSTDPLVAGHVHDGEHSDGHAQKINLRYHVVDQVQEPNVGDVAVGKRSVAVRASTK